MARITMRQAITDALREEMIRDEKVFIMGEEVGVWGGTYAVTRGFFDEFGEKRVRDTPIAEMVIGGAAAGAAMNGLRPVAEFMTINFAFLALDAIVNHAAKVHYMFGGNIKCPFEFDEEEEFKKNGNKYMRKSFTRGSDSPVIHIKTSSGSAVLKK